jgi:hypothetical protein
VACIGGKGGCGGKLVVTGTLTDKAECGVGR